MTQTMHVISHTHWDREWYRPFQVFRARLVEVVDAVLDLLASNPEYRYFHLDGQTIVLEDYLEIRPEREQQLRQFIREGRLLLGPWYSQPDEFLVSGEAMVRNLLRGRHMAREAGGCMDLGYLPDSFGHASQMPQIFAGFGFAAAIVFRGITADQVRSAFVWRGADQTALLTIRLPDDDAYSNYLYRLLPTLADPNPIDYPRLDSELTQLRRDSESMAVCDQLLWMDGVDHIFPNPKTPEIIRYANQTLQDATVIHSTLPAYVQALTNAKADLKEVHGELRHADRAWRLQAVLANVASSHIEVKQSNARVEGALERVVEPLSAIAWLHGAEYPRTYLEQAWKYLLQNHCHDSICGCSVDQVHRDMHYRYDQALLIADVVRRRALESLAAQVNTSSAAPDERVLLLFNPLPSPRNGTVIVDAPLPPQAAGNVTVQANDGKPIPCQVLAIADSAPLRQPRYDIPRVDHRRVYRLAFEADVPAYGFAAYRIAPASTPGRTRAAESLFVGERTMDNGLIKATVELDGTLTVEDKQTGKVYRGLLALEDRGDGGEGWNWVPPQFDRTYLSPGSPVEMARLQDGSQLAALQARIAFRTPAGFTGAAHEHDPWRMQRSEALVDMPAEIVVSLRRRSRVVDVAVTLQNNALNHRVRLLFPTDTPADVCHADGAFDVVERSIAQVDSHDWREPQLGTYPHHSFVSVEDGLGGLAVLTNGTPEYEVIDEPRRTVAITLLRAFGRGAGEPHEYVDSQEIGSHTYQFGVYPYTGTWQEAGVVRESRAFGTPLSVTSTTGHKGTIEPGQGLLRVEGSGIDVTAVKRCEDRNSLLVRLVNLTGATQSVTVGAAVPIREVYRLNLAEDRQSQIELNGQTEVQMQVASRQILTLEFVPS